MREREQASEAEDGTNDESDVEERGGTMEDGMLVESGVSREGMGGSRWIRISQCRFWRRWGTNGFVGHSRIFVCVVWNDVSRAM